MFDLECGVRLRAFRPPPADDLDGFLSLYNNPKTAPQLAGFFVVPQGERLKEELKALIDKAEMFCIIETIPSMSPANANSKDKPQFVGITGLIGMTERGNRHTVYSIGLLPEFWNKGYGTSITKFMVDHAFVHLNMHRISLVVFEGNGKAVAVYEKCGFVHEGRHRKETWANGGWRDTIHMGMLVEDWKELRKVEGN